MVTAKQFVNTSIMELYGLSTDDKPTTVLNGEDLPVAVGNGSCFIEMDTSKIYFFNGAAQTWVEFN